jgi:predicted amidohydrolase
MGSSSADLILVVESIFPFQALLRGFADPDPLPENPCDLIAPKEIAYVSESFKPVFRPSTAGGPSMSPADQKPRKVVVGTSMFGPYGQWPGLGKRLDELGEIIDAMAACAHRQAPSKSLDLAVLTEDAVCGGSSGTAADRSVLLQGEVLEKMGAKARQHCTYLVLPLFLREEDGTFSNAAVLLDRQGEVAGIYRKVHPVLGQEDDLLEGGVIPGRDFPVFTCDFGKVGIQICFDMAYDDGWDSLVRQGAEIIAWPTQSPQTARTACRALRGRCYVVSSTWRNNLSLFEPTGMPVAQVREPERLLVEEIDLSYALLSWSSQLRNGQFLTERFGDRVGYRYYESEDRGLFWSNDPSTSIGDMIRELGLEEAEFHVERHRRAQDAARTATSI